jgi:hypothetical protein
MPYHPLPRGLAVIAHVRRQFSAGLSSWPRHRGDEYGLGLVIAWLASR